MRPRIKTLKQKLIGRTITAVDLNVFRDGRGGWTTDPIITLDNGLRLGFWVEETDVGRYGVKILMSPAPSTQHKGGR